MSLRRALTRREILAVTALSGAGAAVAAVTGFRRVHTRDGATTSDGPDERTLGALLGVVTAVAHPDVRLAHYRSLFAWRVKTEPAYADLYRDFAAALEREAGSRGLTRFESGSLPQRREIITVAASPVEEEPERLPYSRTLADEPNRFRWYVVDEVLELFAWTDALVIAGWDGWPGVPTGLDDYRKPIAKKDAGP